eukprot:IDg22519t1
MDPVVLDGLRLVVAWQSWIAQKPKLALVSALGASMCAERSVSKPDRAMGNNKTKERGQEGAVVTLSVGR